MFNTTSTEIRLFMFYTLNDCDIYSHLFMAGLTQLKYLRIVVSFIGGM